MGSEMCIRDRRIPGTSFRFFLVIHTLTSRALTGSYAVPSRGPRGIPLLVVEMTLNCRCNYRDCKEIAVDGRGNSIAADDRGLPWKLLWQMPWTSVAFAVYRRIGTARDYTHVGHIF